MVRGLVSIPVALLATMAGANATVYDLAGQFNAANASNGPWTYGYETTLGTPFIAYPNQETIDGYAGRADPSVAGFSTYGDPSDFINTSSSTVSNSTVTLAAGQAAFHPGEGDQISIYRFTAPTTGTYTLNATFQIADVTGSGRTTVLIDENNGQTTLFSANLTQYGVPVSTGPTTLALVAGQFIDFGVEQTNGQFLNDTTAGGATLSVPSTPTPVPEPDSFALIGSSLLALGFWRRKFL